MNKAILVVLATGAAFAGGMVAWKSGALHGLTDDSNGAIGACEAHTLAGLVSPSSYVRRKAEYFPKPALSYDEGYEMRSARDRARDPVSSRFVDAYSRAIEREGPGLAKRSKRGEKLTEDQQRMLQSWQFAETRRAGDKQRIAENRPADRSAVVIIEYDADNQYGASIRSVAYCRFDAQGDDGRFAETDILQSGPAESYEPSISELLVQSGQIELRDSDAR